LGQRKWNPRWNLASAKEKNALDDIEFAGHNIDILTNVAVNKTRAT
jgi:hypothetical protein